MKLETGLPLSCLFFKHWAADDREIGVVVAQAGFRRGPDGRFYAEPTAPELRFEDSFAGDPACSALLSEQDIAPVKTATDLMLLATARSPEGRAMADWPVRLQIAQRLQYEFRVRGPVHWQRNGPQRAWRQDPPQPVTEVALDFALAYGGVLRDAEGQITDFCAANPAGTGFVTKDWLDARSAPFAAPQIGLLADWMAADPLAPLSVHGTGPVAKTWTPRRAFAGTFDADWSRDRHPRMPVDFQTGFWNAAPRPLQLAPFLTGSERIVIEGVSARGPVEILLPEVALGLVATGEATLNQRLVLDTLEIDLRRDDPGEHRLRLTWRSTLADPGRFRRGELLAIAPAEPEAPR